LPPQQQVLTPALQIKNFLLKGITNPQCSRCGIIVKKFLTI
jgi:hypothetical protein